MLSPKIHNTSQCPDYYSESRVKRTPTGTQFIPNQQYLKVLRSYKEAVITTKAITIRRQKAAKIPGTQGRVLTDQQKQALCVPRYTGLMTAGAKQRFTKTFDHLLFISRPYWTTDPETKKPRKARMTAWTFTFPLVGYPVPGDIAWKVYNHFWDALSHRGIKPTRINKLEFTKLDQAHFHCDVVEYLKYDMMYEQWKKSLSWAGILEAWQDNNPGKELDGCKFRYLWTDQECDRYLWSYLKKETQNKLASGTRIWSCSNDIKNPPTKRIAFTSQQEDLLKAAESKGLCSYYEKSVTMESKDKRVRTGCDILRDPVAAFCVTQQQVVIFKRYCFKSHEDLLQTLTLFNLRHVSATKKLLRSGSSDFDDNHLTFSYRYDTYVTTSQSVAPVFRFPCFYATFGGVIRTKYLHGPCSYIIRHPLERGRFLYMPHSPKPS